MNRILRSLRFRLFNLASRLSEPFLSDRELSKPVFIVGVNRSGTRLLEEILLSSGVLTSWSEANHVWEPSYYPFLDITTPRPGIPGFRGTGVHAHEVPRHHETTLRRRVKRLFQSYERIAGDRLVHRNPFNCMRVRHLKEWFAHPRIVHIFRDARAAVNSFVTKHRDREDYSLDELADQAIYRWKTCFERVRTFAETNPAITREIKYAELSGSNRDSRLRGLFEFCDLPVEDKPWQTIDVENRNYKWKDNLEPRILKKIETEINDSDPSPLAPDESKP